VAFDGFSRQTGSFVQNPVHWWRGSVKMIPYCFMIAELNMKCRHLWFIRSWIFNQVLSSMKNKIKAFIKRKKREKWPQFSHSSVWFLRFPQAFYHLGKRHKINHFNALFKS
jgi:hypothetical protein